MRGRELPEQHSGNHCALGDNGWLLQIRLDHGNGQLESLGDVDRG